MPFHMISNSGSLASSKYGGMIFACLTEKKNSVVLSFDTQLHRSAQNAKHYAVETIFSFGL